MHTFKCCLIILACNIIFILSDPSSHNGKFKPDLNGIKPPITKPNLGLQQPTIPEFNCPKLSPPPVATNVNQLRPGNIKVVMALGDSITAGFGMHSGHFWDVLELVEYRGDVFSIGMDSNFTIPSFLRNYNPDIVGGSVGWEFPLDILQWQNKVIQPWNPPITRLNAAQTGAQIQDVAAQVDYLTEQILTTFNESIDMDNDWKLLTLFIGANNICNACMNYSTTTEEFFEENLRLVVEKVQKQIPRTFMSIIQLFNISQVYNISIQSDYCDFMWDTFCYSECVCMTSNSTEEKRHQMDLRTVDYNNVIEKVAQEVQSQNLTDFTVKFQPFLRDMIIPWDIGVNALSEVDCFHPNWWSNEAFALSYWNNLMSTEDKYKMTSMSLMTDIFVCPDDNTTLH